jgi:hypothetical protein
MKKIQVIHKAGYRKREKKLEQIVLQDRENMA